MVNGKFLLPDRFQRLCKETNVKRYGVEGLERVTSYEIQKARFFYYQVAKGTFIITVIQFAIGPLHN